MLRASSLLLSHIHKHKQSKAARQQHNATLRELKATLWGISLAVKRQTIPLHGLCLVDITTSLLVFWNLFHTCIHKYTHTNTPQRNAYFKAIAFFPLSKWSRMGLTNWEIPFPLIYNNNNNGIECTLRKNEKFLSYKSYETSTLQHQCLRETNYY